MTENRRRARRGGSSGRKQRRPASRGRSAPDDPSLAHFGRTLWSSDLRGKGRDIRPAEVDADSDEDRRGNLKPPGEAPPPPAARGEAEARGPGGARRRRTGPGRRRRRGETAGDGETPPRTAMEPADVVRAYLEGVQETRVRAHNAHRRVARRLGTPALLELVDEWARRWTRPGGKETVLGKADTDGDRATVETTGEGFGPVRYRLERAEGVWRLDAVEGACPDCEGCGRCAVCGGDECDVCDGGACPACQGAGWVPYRK